MCVCVCLCVRVCVRVRVCGLVYPNSNSVFAIKLVNLCVCGVCVCGLVYPSSNSVLLLSW